ncbi:MAG TPA: response regulator transcription factor [Terriglobales bacterium]
MAKPTVLVADDHGIVLTRVVSLLTPRFDLVGTVMNGRDLVTEAERLNPDVIVLDITMPVLSGIEAAHELRKKGSGARLVFLTVHTSREFVEACVEAGALAYVTKSHLVSDLVSAIDMALAGKTFVSTNVLG